MEDQNLIYYALIAGVIGLAFAAFTVTKLMAKSRGSDEVSEISETMPPLGPRVGMVANMQANVVLEILLND